MQYKYDTELVTCSIDWSEFFKFQINDVICQKPQFIHVPSNNNDGQMDKVVASNSLVFFVNKGAKTPVKATKFAACYDLSAHLVHGKDIALYSPKNKKQMRQVRIDGCPISQCEEGVIPYFNIGPKERALIPTGIRTSMPDGYSLRLHPRSGLAIKNGINLINCEGIVDADYCNEIFAAIINDSDEMFTIKNGDRICQAEFVKEEKGLPIIAQQEWDGSDLPKRTDRQGGFGSTKVQ